MNGEQDPGTIPTLSYFEQTGEDSWAILRLILIGLGINFLLIALTGAASTAQQFSRTNGPTTYLLVVSVCPNLAALMLGIGCACCALGRVGRLFTVWSAVVRVLFQWVYGVMLCFSYLTQYRGVRALPPTWMPMMIVQTILGTFGGTVLPVIIIILLRKPLVKRMLRG